MKKFLTVLSIVLCSVILISMPFTCPLKTYAAYSSTLSDFSHNPNNNYYIFFSFDTDTYCYGWYFSISKSNYNSNMVSWNGNIATFNNNKRTSFYRFRDSSTNYSGSDNSITSISIDFSTNKIVNVVNPDFPGNDFKNLTNYYDMKNGEMYFGDTLDTNIPDLVPPDPLNLSFTHLPDPVGVISRSQTFNGVMYNSTGWNISVTNEGQQAQYAWFIVDEGEEITFPTYISEESIDYYGNVVYAYCTDEFTSPHNMLNDRLAIFRPSIWHTIASGDSQSFIIPWSSISLSPMRSYDVVIYACLNDNINGYNTDSTDFVTEIYRSTFQISDPAIFNPSDDYEQNNGVHPWQPNSDNSGLFNKSSAYVDSNGNLNIKTEDNLNYTSFGNGVQSTASLNQSFRNYFAFINGGLSCFPAVFLTILSAGVTGVVVIGLVKVAFK
jgi:hypothetical protein